MNNFDVWLKTLDYMFGNTFASTEVSDNTLFSQNMKLKYLLNIPLRYETINRLDETQEYIICSPIPTEIKNIEIETCVKQQVDRIKDLTNNKKIVLLWSGGIDSTVIFYALVSHNIPFTVFMDKNSINEYPKLADEIMKSKFSNVSYILKETKTPGFILNHIKNNPDVFFITGEIGNDLFGPQYTRGLINETNLFKSLKDSWFDEKFVETFHFWTKKLTGDLKETNVVEFAWSLEFVFKYQFLQLRPMHLGLIVYGHKKNAVHFFDSKEFQQYAIFNHKENTKINPQTPDYKMPFKNFIFKCNGDSSYRNNKLKQDSQRNSSFYWKRPGLDYKRLYFD